MDNNHKLTYNWEESEIDIKRRMQEKREFEANLPASQKEVVDYHRHSNHPFLMKSEQSIGPSCIYENGKMRFYICMELTGKSKEGIQFLPDVRYEAGTYYAYSIPAEKIIGDSVIGSDRLSQNIKTEEGYTTVKLPAAKTIFDIRNSYIKGSRYCFATVPEVKQKSLDSMVENIEAGFRLSVASPELGMLVSYMDILYPRAEEIILQFFKSIGREVAEYQRLQDYSEEETKKSLKLWEKGALRGWKHWGDKKLLHINLFSHVEKMLKKEGLVVETTYKVSDIAKTVIKKQGIDVEGIKDRIKKGIEEKIGGTA